MKVSTHPAFLVALVLPFLVLANECGVVVEVRDECTTTDPISWTDMQNCQGEICAILTVGDIAAGNDTIDFLMKQDDSTCSFVRDVTATRELCYSAVPEEVTPIEVVPNAVPEEVTPVELVPATTPEEVVPKEITPEEPLTPAPKDDGGLTGGGVFLIIFFVTGFVYIAGGCAWNYLKGNRGADLCPNREFWGGLPGLIADGCRKMCHPFGSSNRHTEALN
ncbi:hypothetical protein DIPPA_20826 [Diplonema papillatum]|nr:hypothetical protein DIPPA_20826 [Diplonema papillatum]